MQFRLEYITAGFEFGEAEIKVFDPVKQITVAVRKRLSTDVHPPLGADEGIAVATCIRDIPPRHHEDAVASDKLSLKRESVRKAYDEMKSMILHTLRLARWRTDSSKSPPNPVRWSRGFSWSLDGVEWKPVADNITLGVDWHLVPQWTPEVAAFVQKEVVTDLDEPLGQELLREASLNRKVSLRSSLVLAIAAAEVGFKQFASKWLPDTAWLMELPAPPLLEMLGNFPWSKLNARINGKVATVPESIRSELKKGVLLRNKLVHSGTVEIKKETLDRVLQSVHDLLYLLDALSHQDWALGHVSPEALSQFR